MKVGTPKAAPRSNVIPITEYGRLAPFVDNSLTGASGVHTVAAVLSLRGFIALPTIRNTAGTDIVVTNRSGTWFANLQVKTSRNRVSFWPIGKRFALQIGPNDYYVFLRWVKRQGRFEIFLESATAVAKRTEATLAWEKARRGGKAWQPCYHLKNDAQRLQQQWLEFGNKHLD